MEARIRQCSQCKYLKKAYRASAFSHTEPQTSKQFDMQVEENNEILREKVEEANRIQSRQPFDYPPKFNDWCSRYTLTEGEFQEIMLRESMGDMNLFQKAIDNNLLIRTPHRVSKLFRLAIYQNPKNNCPGFKSKL